MFKIAKRKLLTVTIIILLSVYYALPSLLNTTSVWLPNKKISYGLDLQGGVSITLLADLDHDIKERLSLTAQQFKEQLLLTKTKINNIQIEDQSFTFKYADEKRNINSKSYPLHEQLYCEKSNSGLKCSFRKKNTATSERAALKRSMEIIRKRIDSLGNKEIEIRSLGRNKILLQAPGFSDSKKIKELIGRTSKLGFYVVRKNLSEDLSEMEKIETLLNAKFIKMEKSSDSLLVDKDSVMTGNMLSTAYVINGQIGEPVIKVQLNDVGRKIFATFSTANIGKTIAITIDDEVVSTPVIKEAILNGEGIISGDFTQESAEELALLLRSGALPVPLKIIEERTIGPTLGAESIKNGIKSCYIAALSVSIIVIIYYKLCGVLAVIALIGNFFVMIAVMSIMGTTLTLTGIAGIVLTFGMAVDANVLIFEKIKEELASSRPVVISIDRGYRYAFQTILDSNITTMAAACVLYIFGSSLVKGFALTLIIGLLSSMFTSVAMTNVIIKLWCHLRRPKNLWI